MSVQVKPGSTEWNLSCPSSRASSSRVIKMFASLDLCGHIFFDSAGDSCKSFLPCIDCLRPILFLTVQVIHGGGMKVGIAADGDHSAIGCQEGEEAGGEEVWTQVVGGHHPFQTLKSLLTTSDSRTKAGCCIVDDHIDLTAK